MAGRKFRDRLYGTVANRMVRSERGPSSSAAVPLLILLLGVPSCFPASAGASGSPIVLGTFPSGAAAALSVAPSVSLLSGAAPLPVRFSANAAGGSPPYEYYWSFGDRYASSIATPIHTFLTSGRYQTNLSVTDGLGSTVGWSRIIDVASARNLSVQLTAYPFPLRQGQVVHVNVTTTGGTAPYIYSWVGSIPGCAPQGGSSFECLVNLTACSYPYFEVYVQDSAGHLAQGNLNLNFSGAPPCVFPGREGQVPGDGGLTIGLVLFGPIGVMGAVATIFYVRRRRRLRERDRPPVPV